MNFTYYLLPFLCALGSVAAATVTLPKGATLLESRKGLKLSELQNRYQINTREAESIQKAKQKYFTHPGYPLKWFNESFLKQIHREMFGEIWDWAGIYYSGPLRNIGIESSDIPSQMQALCKEVHYCLKEKTSLTFLQQSVRIQHRILQIHPFTNGNGRFARLVGDLYLQSLQGTKPDWPEQAILEDLEIRQTYVEALKLADSGNFFPLEQLYERFGARNPSIMQVVENPFYERHFSLQKQIELIANLHVFGCPIAIVLLKSKNNPRQPF